MKRLPSKWVVRPLIDILLTPLKYLEVAFQLPSYFDSNERRLVFISVIIGVVVWSIVFLLRQALRAIIELNLAFVQSDSTRLLLFVPLLAGALLMAFLASHRSSRIRYRDKRGKVHELIDVEGDGMERAIALYYTSEPMLEQALLGKEGVDVRWELPTFSLTWRKFLATLVTLGSGGSGGLEASVALIGESTAASLFKPRARMASQKPGLRTRAWNWWRTTNPDDLQTAQLAGIGAAVSTLIGAPLAAAFFATEVMYRRRPVIEKLLYALVAALTAFFLSNLATGGHSHLFEIELLAAPPLTLHYYAAVVTMAIAVAFVDAYFSQVRRTFSTAFHSRIPNPYWRHLAGAGLTGTIALAAYWLTGHEVDIVLGTSESIVLEALKGSLPLQVALVALIAKLYATLATVSSGGSGGLLIPSLYFGAMTGVLVAGVFGLPATSLVIPAMTASLVAIVNVPLAAMFFTVEIFGSAYLLPALVTLVVALIFSHENSIYRTQRERDQSRQILPGYSVRRVSTPPEWAGRTLAELALRARFGVNVIGLIEPGPGDTRIHPNVSALAPIKAGDLLIVLGKDEELDALEHTMREQAFAKAEEEEAQKRAGA
jgi:CIC family chloride channel protein